VVWFRHMTYRQFDRLMEIAGEHRLGLYPIHPHYRTRPARPGLLLGYAGLPPAALETATALLGQCLLLA
jgi:GntR family transcriptional regulator/MocR family aminotransferase